jgi:Polymerase beta, Nucleotidyltransferase
MTKPVRPDLVSIAKVIADWVDDIPGVRAVYLFGSRVRGDHRDDSDIDLRLFVHEWEGDDLTTDWWSRQNEHDFRELREKLPGRLSIHRDGTDAPDNAIRAGAKVPVYVDRKVLCVWTPPKLTVR